MEHQIGQQFESPAEVFFHKDGIDECFFLCRIGVQLSSHILHPVQDMPGLPLFRPFEYHVLHKVSQSEFMRLLIPRSRIHGKTAIRHRRSRGKMHDT